MKKLMVMLGAAALAVCSQAATTKWAIPDQVKFNGTVLSGKQVELWIVGVDGADDVKFDYRNTKSTNPATSKGTLTSGTGDGQASYDYQSTVAGGALASYNDETGKWSDLGREYYIVIKNTVDGIDYTYTSSAKASSGLSGSDLGTVSFNFTDTKTDVAGTKDAWVYASVPEPTSGLLLLLGMAGLALRRRRA